MSETVACASREAPFGGRFIRRANIGLATAVTVALFVLYIAAISCSGVGVYHDDGVYVVTAKALAEGRGYRIISLPEEPPQTKYPPLFPFALSLLWRLNPEFPSNVRLLKLVPFAALIGWLVATYHLLTPLKVSRSTRLWVCLAVAASPASLYFGTALLSEVPFAFLATVTLLLITRGMAKPEREKIWISAAATACAAAFLTRSIGIALAAACLFTLLCSRRFRLAILFGGVFALLVSPWLLWSVLQPTEAAQGFYSVDNYKQWNVLSGQFALSEAANIIGWNLLLGSLAPLNAYAGFDVNAAMAILVVVANVFCLYGVWRRGSSALLWWLMFYSLVVVLWVWPSFRFLFPLLPLWLIFTVSGLSDYGAMGRGVAILLLVTATAVGLARSTDAVRNGLRNDCIGPYGLPFSNWKPLMTALHSVRQHESPKAILAGNLDPLYYLVSERKAIRSFTIDPYALHYGRSGHPLGSFTEWQEGLDKNNVSIVVSHDSAGFTEAPLLRPLEDELLTNDAGGWAITVDSPQVRLLRRQGAAEMPRRSGCILNPFEPQC